MFKKICGKYKMSIDAAGCEANPDDPRCSCYNVVKDKCTENPDIPGCKEGNEWMNRLLEVIPDNPKFDGAKELIKIEAPERFHCKWTGACEEGKFRPEEYDDVIDLGKCWWKTNVCAADVKIGSAIDMELFKDCTITEVGFHDLDATYAVDPSVQAILGLRTAETSSAVAARNKELKLKLRAEDRQAAADEAARRLAGADAEVERIQRIGEAQKEKTRKQTQLLMIGVGVSILLIILILNVK